MLEPSSARLAHADLLPADVDISDIEAASEGGARSLGFVVREVHARLACHLQRKALIEGKRAAASRFMILHATVLQRHLLCIYCYAACKLCMGHNCTRLCMMMEDECSAVLQEAHIQNIYDVPKCSCT